MDQIINRAKNWQHGVGFICVWLVLTAINLHWGIDDWYKYSFGLNQAQDFSARISSMDFLKDPAYFLVQACLAGIVDFQIFFGLLIFFCLALKFSALLRVNSQPSILDVAPYLLVLGFLHEGIQMRIAIALSIGLWAIVLFAKGQRLWALVILSFAATFHISVATYFLVFALMVLWEHFGKSVWICCGILTGLLAYTSVIPSLLIKVGVATNARFLLYSQGIVFEHQNSTGLFQYFVLFVAFITLFVWRYYRPVSIVWKNLYYLALTSGFLAIAILQVFRFNVVVSSRLADLLLLPVLLVLGATLVQLKGEKKYLPFLLMLAALTFYCAARGFVSFNPLLFRTY